MLDSYVQLGLLTIVFMAASMRPLPSPSAVSGDGCAALHSHLLHYRVVITIKHSLEPHLKLEERPQAPAKGEGSK